jgi:hypothetical protein
MQRDNKMARKRSKYEKEEALSGRELRRNELAVAVVDRVHRHKMQLRRTIKKPGRLIDIGDTN